MHLSWLGGTALKIQTKPLNDDVTVVVDAYKPDNGSFPRSLTPNIAIFTRGEEGSIPLSGNPFIISTPGEYEIKGVLITVGQGKNGELVCRVDAENLTVGHLGLRKTKLDQKELEALGDVDILCVPAGGGESFDIEGAIDVANTIEPRLIIPIATASDNDPKALSAEAFAKAFGSGTDSAEKKLIMKKKDLPQEETKVVLLAKE